jgi:hypothetical protein
MVPSTNVLMVFLASFCIGLIFVALVEPKPEVIVRWPTPKNAGLVTYLDRASNCYKYTHQEVTCTDTAETVPIESGEGMSNNETLIKDHIPSLEDYYR